MSRWNSNHNDGDELNFDDKDIKQVVDDLDDNTKPHYGLKNLIRITSIEREIKHLSENKHTDVNTQEKIEALTS